MLLSFNLVLLIYVRLSQLAPAANRLNVSRNWCVSFYSVVVLCQSSSHALAVSVFVHGVVSGSNVYVMFYWEIRNGSCRLQLLPRLCVLTCFLVSAFACDAPRN